MQELRLRINAEHESAGGGGVDLHPVRSYFANGAPASIYLGSKKQESSGVYAEAIRRMTIVGQEAEAFGAIPGNTTLESGRHFPHPDFPHVQVKGWRLLPRVHGPA